MPLLGVSEEVCLWVKLWCLVGLWCLFQYIYHSSLYCVFSPHSVFFSSFYCVFSSLFVLKVQMSRLFIKCYLTWWCSRLSVDFYGSLSTVFWTLAIVSNLWPGIVVFSSGVSACYSTSSLVSTGMGDRLCRHATSVCNQTTWATQSPCLSGMGNGCELKSSEALWPGSKGRRGLFHWWINVMPRKTVP